MKNPKEKDKINIRTRPGAKETFKKACALKGGMSEVLNNFIDATNLEYLNHVKNKETT